MEDSFPDIGLMSDEQIKAPIIDDDVEELTDILRGTVPYADEAA